MLVCLLAVRDAKKVPGVLTPGVQLLRELHAKYFDLSHDAEAFLPINK